MRKRSSYRPKGVRLDNVSWVIAGIKPLTELPDVSTLVRAKNHGAMRALVLGEGTKQDVQTVIEAINMTEALAGVRETLGADWREEIHTAQDALLAMARRGIDRGRFLLTGAELNAVNLAMEIHDTQLNEATVIEIEKALDLIRKTIAGGKAIRVVELDHA